MSFTSSLEALHAALANVDEAIGALELRQERQERRRGPISSASVEELITERDAVMQAIAQIEKLTATPSDPFSRRWAHVSRRHDLEYPRNEDGY